jgi:O-acetyl-ADP-ribose deacetylase
MNIKIDVRQGSVTDADVDVIVNASNTLGQLGSGVSGAIRVACGPAFQDAIFTALERRGGSMAPGDVILTHAGAHPRAKFVVHVAVMDYRDNAKQVFPDEARIRRGSERLWRLIDDALPNGSYSIGMVALGAGTGSLGVTMPTEVACETLKAHVASRESSKIASVLFHGFMTNEYINVLDVVSAAFPDMDTSHVDPEVLALIARVRAESADGD